MSDRYDDLRAMVRYLARLDPDHATEENGAGFSAADGPTGHRLARYDHWNAAMARDAWLLLRRYRDTQLRDAGFDYDAVAEPIVIEQPVAVRREASTLAAIAPQTPVAVVERYGPVKPRPSAVDILGPRGVIAQRLPRYEHRPGQLAMAQAVEEALASGEHLVVEAGTGTGKSLAYLIPAILSGDGPVLVSTADKALQDQIWLKDIPFLQEVLPAGFRAALLKGRSNYACRAEVEALCSEERDMFGQIKGLRDRAAVDAFGPFVEWYLATEDGEMDRATVAIPPSLRADVTVDAEGCLGKSCGWIDTCFAERAKARARSADIVVVNHAMLLRDLTLRAMTDGHAGVLPEAAAVVVDECHELEDSATNALGSELTAGRWQKAARAVAKLTTEHPALAGQQGGDRYHYAATLEQQAAVVGPALTILLDAIDRRMGRRSSDRLGDEREVGAPTIEAITRLRDMMRDGVPDWLQDEGGRVRWQKLTARIATIRADLLLALTPPETVGDRVRYAERDSQGRVSLHVKPIDVSGFLRAQLFAMVHRDPRRAAPTWDERSELARVPTPVICTSATITSEGSFRYWRSRVGLTGGSERVVESPFDYRRSALIYLPAQPEALAPTSENRAAPAYFDTLAAEIERLLLASDGRAFVLFTSLRALNEVHERIASRLRWLVLRQGDAPRPVLIERFKADGRAVLFGVKSFWQGVDVPGEALSLVIMDKLPFPPPDDPVWQGRIEAAGDRWFFEVYLPFAVIALKQGAGRLVRSTADRGVIALLDGRLLLKGYGSRVLGSLPSMTRTRSIEAVRTFFGGAA
ncbi:MAG: ATP-dependent DNA helicase [Dehalococcoidia bacterium]